ncbi:MAG: AI-2E family transporter [Burkholderiales bacterium]|nr:AI-2E family transporter [Burkholderiales bacterium]MDP2397054.1 AI-2E family transporter [Burkholderiales bacterium]
MDIPGRTPQHLWQWLVVAAIAGIAIYLLSPILTPFMLAAILAYICNPLVGRMTRVPRALATALVLVMLLLAVLVLLVVLLPLLIRQVRAIADQAPVFVDWLRVAAAPRLEQLLGVQLETAMVRDWMTAHLADIRDFALKLLPKLTSGGLAVVGFLVNLVLVPLVLFYFLRDWDRIIAGIDGMIPRRYHGRISMLAREIDGVLGQFLRGQLLVMLAMALFYTVGLWLAGLDYALSVGIFAGLVTFVPYLGIILGVVLATLAGLLQFQELTPLIWIWAVFIVASLIEGYLLVPWLVGERIGLHPVAVIFALLAFGSLFGFFGVLLALPVSAALLVWGRHLHRDYLASGMYR